MAAQLKSVLGFASEREATLAGAILSEMPDFESLPVVVLECGARWLLECYDGGELSREGAGFLSEAGVTVLSVNAVEVPDTDWVLETQKALPPIRAGRFLVHGSHDREQALSKWAIEIDAGRAFGTAHHGTTMGCLLAIGRLSPVLKPRSVLDLGTGSGILAISAAKAFSHRALVDAADIDPVAVTVARENCRKNGAAASVRLFAGDGLIPVLAYRGPYDIAIANILAKPLLKLAPKLRQLVRPRGVLILSGLLSGQVREILARYRATGFVLSKRRDLEGWATLTLKRVQ
jgi:ribosomal protein L11 methyltransferase